MATDAMTGASARPITGGPSRMTMSKCSAASFTRATRRGPISNSAGLGGNGPLVIRNRFGQSVGWTAAWSRTAPVSRLEAPTLLSAPKILC